jgi:hypothetical protein
VPLFGTLQLDASHNPIPLSDSLCFISDGSSQCVYMLPTMCNLGTTFRVIARDNLWTIQQGAGQRIAIGISTTTSGTGGSLTANKLTDAVEIVAVDTGNNFRCQPLSGNPTVV